MYIIVLETQIYIFYCTLNEQQTDIGFFILLTGSICKFLLPALSDHLANRVITWTKWPATLCCTSWWDRDLLLCISTEEKTKSAAHSKKRTCTEISLVARTNDAWLVITKRSNQSWIWANYIIFPAGKTEVDIVLEETSQRKKCLRDTQMWTSNCINIKARRVEVSESWGDSKRLF